MIHEFTHVVEAEETHLSLDWTRSIAHTIFVKGLAMGSGGVGIEREASGW